jgi:hypothetical protein
MESDRIEILIEKYFEGETSTAEEQELRNYFSSSMIAPHLEQYQSLFGYFSKEKALNFNSEILLNFKKRNIAWLSTAASVVVVLGIGTVAYLNYKNTDQQDLGSYDNPEVALKETQKALALLSENVNVGIKTVRYVEEYEMAKEKVFLP